MPWPTPHILCGPRQTALISTTAKQEVCQYLNWDSEFFGCRIGSVVASQLTSEKMSAVEDWANTNGIDCLYFLAQAEDQRTIRLADEHGFQLVDIRVTLENDNPEVPGPDTCDRIRQAQPHDVPALKSLARVSHRNTRFYCDGHFPHERCDELYATWIEKSCNGFADCVLVAGTSGEPVGYLSCKLGREGSGEIGLTAVAADAQGKGLGGQLVSASLRWFTASGVRKIRVVTQGRNIRAQRLYQSHGFLTRKVELSYHRWYAGDRGWKNA